MAKGPRSYYTGPPNANFAIGCTLMPRRNQYGLRKIEKHSDLGRDVAAVPAWLPATRREPHWVMAIVAQHANESYGHMALGRVSLGLGRIAMRALAAAPVGAQAQCALTVQRLLCARQSCCAEGCHGTAMRFGR